MVHDLVAGTGVIRRAGHVLLSSLTRSSRVATASETPRSAEVTPSPNIWRWPQLYEEENRAQDVTGEIFAAIRRECDWTGLDVVDVGCGDGFHLPMFAENARSVVGVEPHPPLAEHARVRVQDVEHVDVRTAPAQRLPLADSSVDLVHARTAYFFGPGCEPGMVEAERVLRPGGFVVVVDLDAACGPYGDWMREDSPHYDPAVVESFFARHGFSSARVDTLWRFENRASLEAVLRIEFSPRVARRAVRECVGHAIPVGYRLRVRRKPIGLLMR